jgi:two-component system chemotaxis response regulator CheY
MGTTVLIADDAEWSAITLEVLALTLPDVNVVRAGNGQEAWRLAEEQPVSAIITDLRMPRMDGFELIERVRARSIEADIPIIVVTADSAPETQDKAQRLGANAFFVKPYSPAAVRKTLKELLHDTEPDAPL